LESKSGALQVSKLAGEEEDLGRTNLKTEGHDHVGKGIQTMQQVRNLVENFQLASELQNIWDVQKD
jgi:hypothetical protein